VISKLVAYCSECKHYDQVEAAGGPCHSTECTRKLRKRRGWVCAFCTEIHFGKKPKKCWECGASDDWEL
jgi:hypothetical protein